MFFFRIPKGTYCTGYEKIDQRNHGLPQIVTTAYQEHIDSSYLITFCSFIYFWSFVGRRVWRYQRRNQNPYIEEEQTAQWQKENKQKDKQRSTKHTHKTKDRVTRTTLKTRGELGCSGRVSSSCFTSDIRRVGYRVSWYLSSSSHHPFDVVFWSLFYPPI